MSVTSNFIDLSDHDNFVDAVPYEAFAQLRREDPVHWNPEPNGGQGFWAVTRYEDIRTVHRSPESFSSELGGTSLEDLEPEHIEARKSMIDMDPPHHDELRALVNRRFTPKAVGVWEEQVRKVVKQVLDGALPKGEFDFVHEISSEIPMQVFAEILGVPQDERREIIEIGDRLLGNADPEYAHDGDDDAHRHLPFSSPAALDMFAFGRRIADERRHASRDDIMSDLVNAGLSQREMDVYFVLLATAGNETTRHTISHGLIALSEHPDERDRLRAGFDELGKTAAEEMLRWATPVHHFRRTAAVDTELAGQGDPRGRQGHDLVRFGQPRRERLRGAHALRCRPLSEQAHDLRARRSAPLSRRPPGEDGDPYHVRGSALAWGRARARRATGAAALELLQRDQADAGDGSLMIELQRIDHVCLRVADLEEAADCAEYLIQFGLHVSGRRGDSVLLSCDDEPCALELIAGAPAGLDHVAYELARGCSLDAARTHLVEFGAAVEDDGEGGLMTADADGNGVQIQPYREPSSRLVAHARPAGGAVVGHPRKLGHVNFLTGNFEEQCRFYTEGLAMQLTDWLGEDGVWFHINSDHHVVALIRSRQPTPAAPEGHFHHLAFDVIDIGQMRVALDHLGRHGRWLGWGPTRHGVGGNIASYVRIVEEECFVELYCDMEQLQPDHQPRRWPDDRFSSNTWGPLPPRSYFRFDQAAIDSERESLEMLGTPLPPAPAKETV